MDLSDLIERNAAFAPDKGESVNTLLADLPADAPQPPRVMSRTSTSANERFI